jgi:hypothetical protein
VLRLDAFERRVISLLDFSANGPTEEEKNGKSFSKVIKFNLKLTILILTLTLTDN